MKIIAHRGASREAPENTLAAFRLAWELGAHGAELDVHRTRDRQLVVIHDENTVRTTGHRAEVCAATYQELRALDAGCWKGEAWRGEPIARLPEVLDSLPRGRELMVEIKGGAEAADGVREELELRAPQFSQLILLCFQSEFLAVARQGLPPLRAYLNLEPPGLGESFTAASLDALIRRAQQEKLDGLSFGDWPGLDRACVQRVHAAGLGVAVWTVDELDRARELQAAGVDYLMTNDPRRIRP